MQWALSALRYRHRAPGLTAMVCEDETLRPGDRRGEGGRVKFMPERFTRTYLNWVENVRDWCISRQLWWGHRIPARYCSCGEMIVDYREPDTCPSCGGKELTQDPDVLDTWFSSALWPFSTLGWPDETPDLKRYFPTSVLVTGYDIIYFWVARMLFMSLEFTGEIPFHTVYINGLVRDHLGRKMSKSLGNGVDPLEVIEDYGADTLRFTLITGQAPGHDQRFRQENVEAGRNFSNKIWNASRFVLMNLISRGEGQGEGGEGGTTGLQEGWAVGPGMAAQAANPPPPNKMLRDRGDRSASVARRSQPG